MRARGGILAVALAASSAPGAAWGSAHPGVSLSVDACAGVDEAEVAAQLTIELGAELLPAGPGVTRVKVRCEGAVLVLGVDDPVTGKSLERRVELGNAAPKARTRLLAIAIAELVSASWTELETNPTPIVPPAGPPPPPAAKAAARDVVEPRTHAPRVTVDAAFDLRAYPGTEGTGALFGIATRFSTAGRGLGGALDLVASEGHGDKALGSVTVDLVGVGAFATYGGHAGPLHLVAGLGARGGSARLGGTPRDASVEGRSLRGAFLGPAAMGALDVRVVGPLVLVAGVEVGFSLVRVRALADGAGATTVGGVHLGARVGLGLAF